MSTTHTAGRCSVEAHSLEQGASGLSQPSCAMRRHARSHLPWCCGIRPRTSRFMTATRQPMRADARTVSRLSRTSPTSSRTAYIWHMFARAQHPAERWHQPCSAVPQLLKETSSPNVPSLRSRTREARRAHPNAATERGGRRSTARQDQGRRTAPPAAARRSCLAPAKGRREGVHTGEGSPRARSCSWRGSRSSQCTWRSPESTGSSAQRRHWLRTRSPSTRVD